MSDRPCCHRKTTKPIVWLSIDALKLLRRSLLFNDVANLLAAIQYRTFFKVAATEVGGCDSPAATGNQGAGR